MSDKVAVSGEFYDSGYSCGQSVLAAFCEDYDLDQETALMLACGFAGGCQSGELCGAVAGGVCVVGLKYGQSIEGDTGAKANCLARTTQLLEEFKKRYGSIVCRELLGADSKDESIHPDPDAFCGGLVSGMAEILQELGY